MRVYYLTGAQHGLSNVALRRIKVARFADLNDPFELLGVDLGKKEYRAAFLATKRQINADRGLLCFSKSWKNPLLWGHYAERHTGVCLGFDVDDQLLAPVIYAKQLLKIRVDSKTKQPRLTEATVNRLLRTKFHDWRYEDEVRLFVGLDHKTVEGGMYFYSFSNQLALREVILGANCALRIEGVQNVVDDYEQSVRVLKARLAFKRFNVVEDRSARTRVRSRSWGAHWMKKKPWISALVNLAFSVNVGMEKGYGSQVSFKEIYAGIENGRVFEQLNYRFPGVFDFSVVRPDSSQQEPVFEALRVAAQAFRGRERRKVGVERDGLALLMAVILEALQQGYWTKPPRWFA